MNPCCDGDKNGLFSAEDSNCRRRYSDYSFTGSASGLNVNVPNVWSSYCYTAKHLQWQALPSYESHSGSQFIRCRSAAIPNEEESKQTHNLYLYASTWKSRAYEKTLPTLPNTGWLMPTWSLIRCIDRRKEGDSLFGCKQECTRADNQIDTQVGWQTHAFTQRWP